MRKSMAIAAVLTFALAGCADSDTTTSTTTTSSTTGPTTSSTHNDPTTGPTSSATTTQTTTSSTGQNNPPTGTLAVDVPSGGVPLNVTFTMTGTDADGDALSWTLDVDGDGSPEASQDAPANLPASYQHTYTSAASYNATYSLSDGEESASYTVRVDANSTTAAITFTGTVTAPDPFVAAGEGCVLNVVATGDGPDNFGDVFELPPAAAGGTYMIEPAGMHTDFWSAEFAEYLAGGSSGAVPAEAAFATTCGGTPDNVNVPYTLSIVPTS